MRLTKHKTATANHSEYVIVDRPSYWCELLEFGRLSLLLSSRSMDSTLADDALTLSASGFINCCDEFVDENTILPIVILTEWIDEWMNGWISLRELRNETILKTKNSSNPKNKQFNLNSRNLFTRTYDVRACCTSNLRSVGYFSCVFVCPLLLSALRTRQFEHLLNIYLHENQIKTSTE